MFLGGLTISETFYDKWHSGRLISMWFTKETAKMHNNQFPKTNIINHGLQPCIYNYSPVYICKIIDFGVHILH